MNTFAMGATRLSVVTALLLAACGGTEGDLAAERQEEEATVGSAAAHVNTGTAVTVGRCTYTISTAFGTGLPPQSNVVVTRSGPARYCHAQSNVIGSSYHLPTVLLTTNGTLLAATWTSYATPSGEAHSQLQIASVSPATLKTVRTTQLAAFPTTPSVGNVSSGVPMATAGGPALTVLGTFDGQLKPGTSGTHYSATWSTFFTGTGSGVAPDTLSVF